jgi:hypothetical protein
VARHQSLINFRWPIMDADHVGDRSPPIFATSTRTALGMTKP